MVIYTAHGFYFHENMKRWAKIVTIGAERLLGRFHDLLLTQSAEDAQAAVNYKITTSDRVVWIGNGIDIDRFTPENNGESFRQRFGILPHERVVGFVGRLVSEKGMAELLEGMNYSGSRVDNLVLLVVGDNKAAGDRDSHTESAVADAASADQPYRAVFTGFVDEVEEAMSALDVFVLPSYREGMPRTIIEAMASGKPVVATRIRGCREEVVQGETGYLVPVRDGKAIGEALVQILNSRAVEDTMQRNGRKRAEEHFDERQVLDREIAAYSRLVRERFPWAEPEIQWSHDVTTNGQVLRLDVLPLDEELIETTSSQHSHVELSRARRQAQ
jgi:glycosyltransferase involved in cell wall biosynthesis